MVAVEEDCESVAHRKRRSKKAPFDAEMRTADVGEMGTPILMPGCEISPAERSAQLPNETTSFWSTTVFDSYLLKSKSAQTVHDLMSQRCGRELPQRDC